MQKIEIPPGEVDALYEKLKKAASDGGYFLNPDAEFAKAIITGLLVNEKRYGYISCPCRIAEGIKEKDLDIICPCDYRDADVSEYGACHCGLYVSRAIAEGKEKLKPVPERRVAAAAAGAAPPAVSVGTKADVAAEVSPPGVSTLPPFGGGVAPRAESVEGAEVQQGAKLSILFPSPPVGGEGGQRPVEGGEPTRRANAFSSPDLPPLPLVGAREDKKSAGATEVKKLAYPVWRCKVCGYLCARNGPPEICPVCKAEKERFERFI